MGFMQTVKQETDKTLADGYFTIDMTDASRFLRHQIQIDCNDVPTAGTLNIDIKTVKASKYNRLGTIDLTDTTELVKVFEGSIDSIKITPVSLDTDTIYDFTIISTE